MDWDWDWDRDRDSDLDRDMSRDGDRLHALLRVGLRYQVSTLVSDYRGRPCISPCPSTVVAKTPPTQYGPTRVIRKSCDVEHTFSSRGVVTVVKSP